MKASKKIPFQGTVITLLICRALFAVPTFQVYIDGATAGDFGPDEESWLTAETTFDLIVVGAFGPTTVSLAEVTLALSVPQGQTGAISITGGDGATLLTTRTEVDNTGVFNPNANADTPILTNVMGNTGYSDKSFLPENFNFNNHYPFQDGVSDFLIYAIDDFENLGPVHDYNADDDMVTVAGSGEEKTFEVSVTDFSWVHFDAYGYVTLTDGTREFRTTWEINPGSHDATFIPAPGAVLLGGIGVALLGVLRRRRVL